MHMHRRTALVGLLALLLLASSLPVAAGIRLQVIFSNPPDSSYAAGANVFKKMVESRTRGEVTIKILPQGELRSRKLGELEMLKAVRSGEVEMAIVTTAPIANYANKLEVLDTPFLLRDDAHVDEVLDGPLGAELLRSVEPAGFTGLVFYDAGFRVFSSNRPLIALKDFRDLRVRTMQSNTYQKFMRLLSADPLPAASKSIYDMARAGYVDAVDCNYPSYWNHRLYEVQKYILETQHAYSAKMFLVNARVYGSLSAEHKKVLLDAARESAKMQREKFRQEVRLTRQRCQEHNVQILKLSPADQKRMVEATLPFYQQASRLISPELMKAVSRRP